MRERRGSLRLRALPLLALLAVLGASDAAAVRPAKWPPPRCPTAAALVAYSVSDGFTFNNDLVIRRDGRASLCWGRRFANRSGRNDFSVSRSTINALTIQLERIGIGALGPPPPPPPGADMPAAALLYERTWIPKDGYPDTEAGIRALRRAEAILDRIIHRHSPR